MQFVPISEIALLQRGAGRGSPDVKEAQNGNVFESNGRIWGLVKTAPELPESSIPTVIRKFVWDPDGFQDPTSTQRGAFNPRSPIVWGTNPVIDFGADGWAAPLDAYINPAVRSTDTTPPLGLFVNKLYRIEVAGTFDWTSVGAADNLVGTVFIATARGSTNADGGQAQHIALAGEFIVGVWYDIDTVGSTDFTLVGAADNEIGTRFRATGVGSGTGVAKFTEGARYGDFQTNTYTDANGVTVAQMRVQAYNYNGSAGNQTVLIESDDEFNTYTVIGETLDDGGNFGRTWADVKQRPGTTLLYGIAGESVAGKGFDKNTFRSADGGRSWVALNSRITLSDDPASPRYRSLVVGRMADADETGVTFFAPASRVANDYPEVNLRCRATWDDLDAGIDWTVDGIASMRDPRASGIWNNDVFDTIDKTYAMVNTFALDDHTGIDGADARILRDTNQFHGIGADLDGPGSAKVTTFYEALNTLGRTAPTYWPWGEGDTVRFWAGNSIIAASEAMFGHNVRLENPAESDLQKWVAVKEGEFFWRFELVANRSLSLSINTGQAYPNRRALAMPYGVRTHSTTDAEDNFRMHWHPILVGNDEPTVLLMQNRESSLFLSRSLVAETYLSGNAAMNLLVETLT